MTVRSPLRWSSVMTTTTFSGWFESFGTGPRGVEVCPPSEPQPAAPRASAAIRRWSRWRVIWNLAPREIKRPARCSRNRPGPGGLRRQLRRLDIITDPPSPRVCKALWPQRGKARPRRPSRGFQQPLRGVQPARAPEATGQLAPGSRAQPSLPPEPSEAPLLEAAARRLRIRPQREGTAASSRPRARLGSLEPARRGGHLARRLDGQGDRRPAALPGAPGLGRPLRAPGARRKNPRRSPRG